ncbi:MAG: hypothetical protein ABWZ64_08375 [Xanthobacteraceae bacterium]|jgi:hypothetical protein
MKELFIVVAVAITSIVAGQAFSQEAAGNTHYHYANQDRGCLYQSYPCSAWNTQDGW